MGGQVDREEQEVWQLARREPEATDAAWLEAVSRLFTDLAGRGLDGPVGRLERLHLLSDRLVRIRPARTRSEHAVLRGVLTELCALLCEPSCPARGRFRTDKATGKQRLVRPGDAPDPVVITALAVMHARAHEERFRESDVARVLGQVYWQVTSRLRTQTGWGFWELLNGLRVARAAALLVEDFERPIGQIARDVGYTRPSDLNRQFPKRFKCTPGEYRRRRRKSTQR
jgi:AraC-like DNA-binding protein